jgi:opacity protein-like surface antigen
MKVRNAAPALTLALAALALPAAAQEKPWYLRIDAGISDPGHSDVHTRVNLFNTGPEGNFRTTDHFTFGRSPLFGLGAGWRFAPGWRAEAGLAYRAAYKLNDTTFGGANSNPQSIQGKVTSLSLMANVYRDFDIGGWAVKPYLGAGFGAARNHNDEYQTERTNVIGFPPGGAFTDRRRIAASTTEDWAWSLAVGMSLKLAGLTWDLCYRYIDLGKLETGPLRIEPDTGLSNSQFGMSGHLRANEITLGLRF